MTDETTPKPTKRTPVPKVEKAKAPPIAEHLKDGVNTAADAVTDGIDKAQDVTEAVIEKTEDLQDKVENEGNKAKMKADSFFKKGITAISNNRETIKRKVIVGVGTGIGMLIASAITDALNRREVVYVDRPVEHLHYDAAPVTSEEVIKQVRRTPRKATPVDDEVEGPNVDDE